MKFAFFILICFSIFSCKEHQTETTRSRLKNLVPYSNYLKIFKHQTFVEVQIISPTTHNVEKKYALISNFKNHSIPKGHEIIHTPIKNMVALTSNQIGMLNELNQISKIKGISNKKFVDNKIIQKKISKGKIIEFGNIEEINPEKIAKMKCDIICYSGFGTLPPNEKKFQLLHTLCIPNYDWNEATPLGKLAWIYLYGYLTGTEKNAKKYFNKVMIEYNSLKTNALKNKNGKTVLSGALIGDSWYLPAGKSYNAILLKDAGANYVEQKSIGHGSLKLSLETCLKKHKNAMIWINPGVASFSLLSAQNKHYEKFSAFKNKSIYCYSHNANFFWENATLQPHRLLHDLIHLSHEKEVKNEQLFFYKKLTQ